MNSQQINSVRYVDCAGMLGWPGKDVGAWIEAAMATLPSMGGYPVGTINLAPCAGSAPIQTTQVVVSSPYVNIEGPGKSVLVITCAMDAPCWDTRVNSFIIAPAGHIGGFTLLGPGTSGTNAVGMELGDRIGGEFYDLAVDNFEGTNSSGLWWNNTNGWFERNSFYDIQLGIHGNGVQNGNKKNVRVTNSGGSANNSFVRNFIYGMHFTVGRGDIGFSVEGGANAPFLSGEYWIGGSNVSDRSTLFSFQGGSALLDSELFWNTECTSCFSGGTTFNVASGAIVRYQGQITQSALLSNSISGTFMTEISADKQSKLVERDFSDATAYNPSSVVASGLLIDQTGNYLKSAGPNITLQSFNAKGDWGVEYMGANEAEQYWCLTSVLPACAEAMRLKASGLQLAALAGPGFRCLDASSSGLVRATAADCGPVYHGSLSTTSSASDYVAVIGMTSSGHCSVTATNASAAANIASTYISAKTANRITVSHTAKMGMTYDILCTSN